MAQDDEIYFKIAADLSDLKPQFQDLSKFWDKHNQDIAKGEKAYRDYGATTEKVYQKVNQKIKENIGQVVNEGKALQQLEKYFKSLAEQNDKAFDTKDILKFNQVLKQVSGGFDFNLSLEDFDELKTKLNNTKDDLEATNVVLDFFEEKLNSSNLGGDKFKELAANVSITKKQLQEAQEQLNLVNSAVSDYDKRPVSQKNAGTFVDLQSAQKDAKAKVQELTVALLDQEKAIQKEANTSSTLTSQLRKVKDELVKLELEGGRGSERWIELSEAAKKYESTVRDVNQEIKRTSSNTAGLDQLIGAATGLVGVFSAAQGAQALFGNESEDLGKALVKLTGAIALLNGLQSIQSELAKKDAIATKALAFVKGQYTIATNSAATATARFGAALKLTGIGLVIAAIAAVVVYWDDIKRAIGGANKETEKSNAINARANDIIGDQRAELTLLIKTAKAQTTTFSQQKDAVKKYNETFGETFGVVKDFAELQQKLTDSGPVYIEYLEKKSRAEAAYQIALEKTKQLHLDIQRLESGEGLDFISQVSQISDEIDKFFGAKVGTAKVSSNKIYEIIGIPDKEEFEKEIAQYSTSVRRGLIQLRENQDDATGAFEDSTDAAKAFQDIAGDFNFEGSTDGLKKEYKGLTDTLEALIKRQRDLKTSLIGNDREREKQVLQDQIADEKAGYEEKIKNLQGSEEKKLQVIQEFNRVYNEETGTAYEKLRQNLKAIDDKYNAELEKVKLNALQAIDEVFLSDEEKQRKAIKDRFDKIRKDLWEQIEITNDAVEKQELATIIITADSAEEKETKDLNKELDTKALDRKRELAKATLEILKSNNKDILNLEKLHTLELLEVDKAFYNGKLDIIKDSFEDLKKQDLFSGLVDELQNSKFIEDIEAVREKLIEAFGEETASEILKTVEALKKVQDEVEETRNSIDTEGIGDKISKTFESFEGFANSLGEALGFAGEDLEAFKTAFVTVADNLYETITNLTNQAVEQQQRRVDAIDEQIDKVENEVEREKELYEQGFANNYDARQQDLENLKAQKQKEEKELQKALKRRAALQKAEFLVQTAVQFGNLITASTNIFAVATTPPVGPFGIPLAIASIAAMFASFAAAKLTALNAINQSSGQNFRTGLKKGKLSLDGPSHEEGGFGLYNSKSGQKVAEMESGEDILVFNRGQKRNYTHVIDALLADANGKTDFETSMRNHYNLTKSGPVTMGVVERVNTVIIKAQTAKGNAAIQDENVIKEIKEFKEMFRDEFSGYKDERENETKTWETPEFYHVQKGNTIKKYPKK